VVLHDEAIARLIRLPETERVVAVWADQHRASVMVGIEGESVDPVGEGMEAPFVARPLVTDVVLSIVMEMIDSYEGEAWDDPLSKLMSGLYEIRNGLLGISRLEVPTDAES
jgi:hypothetical protein